MRSKRWLVVMLLALGTEAFAAPLLPEEQLDPRCAAMTGAGEEAGAPIEWVSLLARWLPRLGGLAVAAGLLWWLCLALWNANTWVQTSAAALLALGFWGFAYQLERLGYATAAAAPVVAGCVASLAAVALFHLEARRPTNPSLTIGAPVTLLWSAAACALSSSLAAYLAALALAVALGGQELDSWRRRSPRAQQRAVLTGASLVAAGAAVQWAGVESMALLVRPLWMVGLLVVFAGSALGWSWRVFEQQSRWLTLALAAASTALGVWAEQGVFAGVGGVALVVWGLACFVELMPRRAPWSLRLMATGAAMVALTLPLEAHWAQIVEVVTRGA